MTLYMLAIDTDRGGSNKGRKSFTSVATPAARSFWSGSVVVEVLVVGVPHLRSLSGPRTRCSSDLASAAYPPARPNCSQTC